MDAEDRTNQEWTHALHHAIENVNSDLPRSVPTTPDIKLLEEMLTDVLRHHAQITCTNERQHLIPLVCGMCLDKKELLRDVKGHYCHRAVAYGYLHDCKAAAIHEICFTPAEQIKEDA